MSAIEISSDVRTRMEGGVELLETLLAAYERLLNALKANARIHGQVNEARNAMTAAADALTRAKKFPELSGLLRRIEELREDVERRARLVLVELHLEVPRSFEECLDAATPQLPILHRSQYTGSWVALGGAAGSVGLLSLIVHAGLPLASMAIPVALSIGSLVHAEFRNLDLIVSQRRVRVGRRSLPLRSIAAAVDTKFPDTPVCHLVTPEGERIQVEYSFELLNALTELGVEIRRE